MAHMKYWFSAGQKRMRDALSGEVTKVRVGDSLKEYTQQTEGNDIPAVWNDFVLVAEGDSLECVREEAQKATAPESDARFIPRRPNGCVTIAF